MDVILKDVTLDGLNYLKTLVVKRQSELMVYLRLLKEDDPSRTDVLDEINKLDYLILNLS